MTSIQTLWRDQDHRGLHRLDETEIQSHLRSDYCESTWVSSRAEHIGASEIRSPPVWRKILRSAVQSTR
jgi:hypothetical protein